MLRGLGAKLGLRGGGIRTPEGVGEKLGYLQIYIPVHGSNISLWSLVRNKSQIQEQATFVASKYSYF